jgi:hypothetical protein
MFPARPAHLGRAARAVKDLHSVAEVHLLGIDEYPA